jgi:hypothetical protein
VAGSFSKIKDRSPFRIDHVLEFQKKSKSEIKGKSYPKGGKRKIYKEKADIFGSHSQLIGKA